MRKIKYIGFYNPSITEVENRNRPLSAISKMDYIALKINQLGWDVEFISPSWTYNNKFYKGKTIQLDASRTVILSPTLPWNRACKCLSILFCELWLFLYLIFNTKKNESIIAYHSLFLMYPLYYAKRFKKFNLTLEVEEIYQDVKKYSRIISKSEYKIIRFADRYIFSSKLLNKKLNQMNKPYCILYGTYQIVQERDHKFEDSKIHIVYAGTFDPYKGGALAAIAAAEYLPESYHVHIIGFGTNQDKIKLLKKVDETSKISKATVTYDGLLKGEEYIQFLQKCHIGLSTQNPNADFNETSFPSKVLSYLANGLRVVSVRIKALETSAVDDLLYYYNEDTPQAIADAIKSVDLNKIYDSRKRIAELDAKFVKDIEKLLK